MNISITSTSFMHIRTVVYVLILAAGLAIAFLLVKHASVKEQVKSVAAVNFAWLAFVFEATTGLSIQWIPYDVWIPNNVALLTFFVTAMFLSVSALLLLTDFKWANRLWHFTSWFSVCINLIILVILARFFVTFGGSFPLLATVMTLNSIIPLYPFYGRQSSIKHQTPHHLTKRFFFSSKILGTILLAILLVGTFAYLQSTDYNASAKAPRMDVYVGVTFGGDTSAQGKLLIDKVSNYTNIFVVDSWPLSQNETALNEVCDYAVNSGLNIIVYFAWFNLYWQAFWLDSAKQRWGDKFLGIYLYDEPGGIQLDRPTGKYGNITFVPSDYSTAAKRYIQSFKTGNRGRSDMDMLKARGIGAFTSDYALYSFDYQAGYDGLFAEFGWNYSRQLNIALVRGAATTQNKEWGVMVTWKFNSYPYAESGDELYSDSVLAYNNGAKYILVFDYPYNSSSAFGILSEEHFDALQKFWAYKNTVAQPDLSADSRVAYVLPNDYGYGFRGPNDTIWGVWQADAVSYKISVNVYNALQQYGNGIDIVYNDQITDDIVYGNFLYWNTTNLSTGIQ